MELLKQTKLIETLIKEGFEIEIETELSNLENF